MSSRNSPARVRGRGDFSGPAIDGQVTDPVGEVPLLFQQAAVQSLSAGRPQREGTAARKRPTASVWPLMPDQKLLAEDSLTLAANRSDQDEGCPDYR